ncbi:MAG: NAD(P)-dependent oxidoreductase [Microbacterium sp.]|uniref:NAD(P)-dependent oxidoreductase n=1 Tax=Microbacterium sp. TaxID=51671 RepID=UPI0039E53C39
MADPIAVGFVGLGRMGAPMARHLIDAGHEVAVWNRTPHRAEPFARDAVIGKTAADVARPVVISMLTDLPDVVEVVHSDTGLLAGWRRARVADPVLVVMGTVSPTDLREFASGLHAAHGVRVVDAPVSGGDVGAQRGDLSIMVGGAQADVDAVMPLFSAMGSVIRHVGPSGAGQTAKACNQVLVAATAAAAAEAITLAERSGLDVSALLELLCGGLAGGELLRQKGWRFVEKDYEGGGALVNQVKDLRFALAQGAASGVPLPIAAAMAEFFATLVSMGRGHLDHTAAQYLYELHSGVVSNDQRP